MDVPTDETTATPAPEPAVPDDDRRYAAMQGRDRRFDGWFVAAVRSTRIYCRPSCPARTPRRENVTFYATPAAAQRSGYRACRRCRPEASPGAPGWRGSADVAARAMQLILDGVVDRHGVSGLAARLGYSERQLHRLLFGELGAGAAALARAQRARTARALLEGTALPVTDVAFAAGFASVRQFNEVVRAAFGCTPSELRRAARPLVAAPGSTAGAGTPVPLRLRLAYRSPLAQGELFASLAESAVDEVEQVSTHSYRRTLMLPRGPGVVELWPGTGQLWAEFHLADLRDLASAVARCRHLANLDADPQLGDAVLARDPTLSPLVAAAPGRRVLGAADGFEAAARAVLGEAEAPRRAVLALGALVRACGPELPWVLGPAAPAGGASRESDAAPSRLFPDAATVAGLPGSTLDELARRATAPPGAWRRLVVVAAAVATGRLDLGFAAHPVELRLRLAELGVEGVAAEHVAVRAIGDPDALPAGPRALAAAAQLGIEGGVRGFERRAERWRPFRSHALAHLDGAVGSTRAGHPVPRRGGAPRSAA